VLPTLEERGSSPRTVRELQPVRVAAEVSGAEEFCIRFDGIQRKSVA
jgi:hypothetical protein